MGVSDRIAPSGRRYTRVPRGYRAQRVLGHLMGTNCAGGGYLGGDSDEKKREQVQRIRPEALQAVDDASDALIAARIEVQRLSQIREIERRQRHADRAAEVPPAKARPLEMRIKAPNKAKTAKMPRAKRAKPIPRIRRPRPK